VASTSSSGARGKRPRADTPGPTTVDFVPLAAPMAVTAPAVIGLGLFQRPGTGAGGARLGVDR
jgi:hypothetical protein